MTSADRLTAVLMQVLQEFRQRYVDQLHAARRAARRLAHAAGAGEETAAASVKARPGLPGGAGVVRAMWLVVALSVGTLVRECPRLPSWRWPRMPAFSTRQAEAAPRRGRRQDRPAARNWFDDLDNWFQAADRHEPGVAGRLRRAIATSLDPERLTSTLADVLALRKQMATYKRPPER